MAKKEEMILEKTHKHTKFPKIECEECGGKVKLISAKHPRAYKCVDCDHEFSWVRPKEIDLE